MENIAPALLDWFYASRRILPFREDPTPYHVWLSEIMLQQTRVSAALPYYERFLAALPDIPALAGCEEEKLHKLWEGLGYYSRVRNLQKAAKIVCAQYGGQLPADYNALLALPGIGEYTAGAIASISFGLPVPAVDGNVLRVFARLYNDPRLVTDPQVKREFTARVMEHQPPAKAGDYNQALMELGALVCLPNEDSADLKYFYPTNTLVTGYDIIGFWVSRMIFSGLAYTGKAPFDTVCIHGIVRDSQGRKMSKSLGNGIDPLEVIAQYGADALRFMLLDGSTPGNDMRYSEKKVEAARNFANKLWNATRFVLMNLPEDFQPGLPEESKLDMSDKWVLTKLNQVAGAMTDNLDHFEMGLAAAKINSFIWDVYCDWFIEIAKPRLNSGDAEQADTARRVLVYVLDKALKLLHPFMPFITEELYQALPGSAETIMTQSWPTFDEAHNWAEEEEAFEKVMDYIKAVRTMRTEMNVHPAKKTSMIIETADPAPFRNAEVYLAKFAFATDVTFTEKYEGSTDGMVQVSTHTARGFIPMMELIDREKELARLNKEKAKAEKELAMFENQLANPKFVERAPAALVEEIRAKRTNSQSKLANIEQSIKALG